MVLTLPTRPAFVISGVECKLYVRSDSKSGGTGRRLNNRTLLKRVSRICRIKQLTIHIEALLSNAKSG